MLKFENISLRPRYNLRRSLAFQTPSQPHILLVEADHHQRHVVAGGFPGLELDDGV